MNYYMTALLEYLKIILCCQARYKTSLLQARVSMLKLIVGLNIPMYLRTVYILQLVMKGHAARQLLDH